MPIHLVPNVVVADRFRLNRELGRGGMGSVWHATHLGLDMPCAVKFIEREMSHLLEAQARFEREAKAAAQLRSPHVVQILDHGVWQGTPYIAMELLDGEELGVRLRRVLRLTPAQVLEIVVPICRALTRAHALGIVHRDLKPDNVFLVRDDDREIPKVLDFGIAKAIGSGFKAGNTRTGALLGTPYYMSPEQAQGIKTVDARSDLWSLAVMVFQMVTGVLPFESEALGDLLVKIIVLPIPTPSRVANGVPPGFDRWWEKASQRDPAQRYQTAKELGDSLVLAIGPSAPYEAPVSFGQKKDAHAQALPSSSGSTVSQALRAGDKATPATGAPTSHTANIAGPASAAATRPLKSFGWWAKRGGAVAIVAMAALAVSFAWKTREPAPKPTASAPTAPADDSALTMVPPIAPASAPAPPSAREASLPGAAPPVPPSVTAPQKAAVTPAWLPRRPSGDGTSVSVAPPARKPMNAPASPPTPTVKRKTVDLGI